MRTISSSQIDALYIFTRQHFVEHYDLQTELVDHLANDIEQIWQNHPELSFEEARDKSFKKFGVFGFMEVVEKRQNAMSKRYNTYLWEEIKIWFGLPKILITIALFYLSFLAFSIGNTKMTYIIIYSVLTLWLFYRFVVLRKKYKSRKKKNNKKWMLEEIIFKQAGVSVSILIGQFPSLLNIIDDYFTSTYFTIGLSIFTTIIILGCFVTFKLLPDKAETLLKDTYPEYNIC